MFYLHPPRGQTAFHIIEDCVFTRIEYLALLYRNDADKFDGNFEYLLEDSGYDKLGHFILRLLSTTSIDLYSYWITRETLLFMHRLNHITVKQLYRLMKKIAAEMLEKEEKSILENSLLEISKFLVQPQVLNHILSSEHTSDCEAYRCKLRFESVPDLVQMRLLYLEQGFCIVPCSKWKEVLQSLFHRFVKDEVFFMNSELSSNIIECDSRLHSLNQRVQYQVLREGFGCGRITVGNVDEEAKKFPLCMYHLHRTLRSRHRLSHYARFYYSLFLKECGMKLSDAIHYWKNEYSKPHSCTSVCSHNWQSSEKKFLYSIRHLYGLEGSRKSYHAPSCSVICSTGSRYEGGCPFIHFDKAVLRSILTDLLTEKQVDNYIKSLSKQEPEKACTALFKLMQIQNGGDITIRSPVQFYLRMIDPN
ncbi:probable DNA primase large subunit isoform X2 [Cephus cinctus]|uniref:Probable DNA primase large subunit isoform X2 n=1 Tax=Cephus cinctus TaxID=211228 RepID=A0AAJ7BVY0_CEPCN|nr:probable DNA primase large subunit isoform X2 [Cephus cinctus]